MRIRDAAHQTVHAYPGGSLTRYKSRFDFGGIAQQTYDRVWPVESAAAIQREIENYKTMG